MKEMKQPKVCTVQHAQLKKKYKLHSFNLPALFLLWNNYHNTWYSSQTAHSEKEITARTCVMKKEKKKLSHEKGEEDKNCPFHLSMRFGFFLFFFFSFFLRIGGGRWIHITSQTTCASCAGISILSLCIHLKPKHSKYLIFKLMEITYTAFNEKSWTQYIHSQKSTD